MLKDWKIKSIEFRLTKTYLFQMGWICTWRDFTFFKLGILDGFHGVLFEFTILGVFIIIWELK